MRVFRGYAGWGPGQLEGEIEAGAWLVLDSEPGDVFSDDPDELWRTVLRRQPGRLAWLADAPTTSARTSGAERVDRLVGAADGHEQMVVVVAGDHVARDSERREARAHGAVRPTASRLECTSSVSQASSTSIGRSCGEALIRAEARASSARPR